MKSGCQYDPVNKPTAIIIIMVAFLKYCAQSQCSALLRKHTIWAHSFTALHSTKITLLLHLIINCRLYMYV